MAFTTYGTLAHPFKTYGTAMAFFLAMVLYPDVQKAAQAELDRVIGPFTAPDFSHRPDLDYM